MLEINRSRFNPILRPNKGESWEAEATFNGCPIKKGNKTYLLYRAISSPHYHADSRMKMQISDIGIAESVNEVDFKNRKRFIVPESQWEKYGCEDPRITKLGKKYYIFYTALSAYPFRAEGIKVGLAISKDLKGISEKHLVTPFNAKAMALFSEKIGGKFWAVLTANTDMPPAKIALASFAKESDIWSESFWKKWYLKLDNFSLPLLRNPQDHIEVGAPPIKTKYGWLLIYSYIKNYTSSSKIFGIEAVLLDLKDPQKIIGRTMTPLITPEEDYERFGVIPNIVFPSGALLEKDNLKIYYGAADTTCCMAVVKLSQLIKSMLVSSSQTAYFERSKLNPIISPSPNTWETKATFNPAAIYYKNKVHIFYRAMSNDNTSVIGYATSNDGENIDYRSVKPAYEPMAEFENKKTPGGNSGCEDPRLTVIGKNVYMCYTAYDGKNLPRVAFTKLPLQKFLVQKWEWSPPVLISPPDFDNKDACLFPEKIKGNYLFFHRMGTDIDVAFVPNLDFDGKTWLEERIWMKPRPGMWDSLKIGIAAPPIKTKQGWILLYHGVSDNGIYRVGAVLLDLKDPLRIIGRTAEPIFVPSEDYEKVGQVPNVVFPCGNVLIKDKIFIYYGGGDSVVGTASILVKDLIKILKSS